MSIDHCFFDDYPTVRNGNRVAKYYWIAISPTSSKLMDVAVEFGIRVSLPNVLFAESLVIVPRPAHSLVAAGAVISLAIWPESARRLGAHRFLVRVPLFHLIIQWRPKNRRRSFCSCSCYYSLRY